MLITCPHCTARLQIDEKIVALTGGGPCPACGRMLAIKVPSLPPPSSAVPIQSSISGATVAATGPTGLLAVGGFAAGMVIVLSAVLVFAGSMRDRPEASPISRSDPDASVRKMLDQLEEELEKRREELRETKKQLIHLEGESEERQQERDSLEREIQQLTTRLEAIHRFQRSDFILVNPNSYAVAIQELEDGRFQVIQKAEGPSQQDVVRWAKKENRFIIDQDHALTRRIQNLVAENDLVPDDLSQAIRRFWQGLDFPIPREELDPAFVVFRRADTGERQVAFYLDHDADELRFRGIAPTDDSIARSQIQLGSVRMARGEKILAHLGDVDFLNFCILRAAQGLTTRDGKPSPIRVAVHLEVDALQEEKKLSKLPDTRSTDLLFEFWSRLQEKPYPRDSRKEPVRLLRELAMYIEDEVYDKLTKLAIPVMERQQVQAVVEENGFGKPLAPSSQFELSQLGATHLLFVDLKKSRQGGRYHLALRLTDVRQGKVLWAQSGEQLVPQPDVQQRFLMQTGRLALMTLKQGSQAQFEGYEEPAVAVPAFLGVKSSREHLVFVEDSVDDRLLVYRPLFSSENQLISRNEVEHIKWVTKDRDVETPHQVRYMVWKLASKILPSAGRAIHVEGDRATITLGLRHGVKHHDTLYVLRELERPDGEHLTGGSPAHALLATSLSVTEIHDHASKVVISGSGLAGWENDEGLRPDDIVITKPGRPMSIAMLAPGWKAPTQKTIYRMDLKNPVKAQRCLKAALQTSVELKDAVGAGLRNVGIPVFTTVTQNDILATGATHVFGGYIQPTDTNCYHVDAMVFPLNARNIGLIRDPKMQIPQLGEELERVEADINLSTFR